MIDILLNKKLILDYHFNLSKNSILSRINQDRFYFSPIYEKRNTFSSSIRDYMTYDYYLKQPKSMCERKLNKILAKNARLINCSNRYSNHAIFRK